jgi:alpha-1,3-rhamnosyl/mannosyltransferase
MRLGIDATSWANKRGYGRFAREIIPAMAALAPHDELVCFLDQASLDTFDVTSPNVTRVFVSNLSAPPSRAASANEHRGLWDMARMTSAVQRANVDVFFFPSVYTYHPLPPGLPAVVTIHDAIPERFPDLVFPSAKTRILWGLKMKLAMFQARAFVTVSEYAAKDLVKVLRIPKEKITVAVEAPSAEYRHRANANPSATSDLPADANWFVYVGGFSRHKNIPLLIRAHAAIARELGTAAPYLLLVGTRDRDDFYTDVESIESAITKEGMSELVKWTGFVSDAELSAIHSRSLGLVLPSECEGFGLPAVEAAACGSPVIATTESPLPELLEGGGVFVRPGDLDALTKAMRRLATDREFRESAGSRARFRAEALSWQKSAAAVLTAIRKVTA